MQRKLGETVFPVNDQIGYQIGDELAQRAAAALADRFDAPTIIMLTDALAFLNRVGGQLYVGTIRREVNAAGQPVADGEDGEFQTFGMVFQYESRDASVKMAKPPEKILGVPVTPSGEHTLIEDDGPAQPEVEPDLRDAIEAEVAEIEAAEEEQDASPEPALTE